jgi:HD-GYP domain-containing protein (c-di-GMP phosphodiesterase class II)
MEGVSDEVVLVVRQHHESLDGAGYPEGLKGDRIHDFARIINLVDGYEAMSAPRVYRDELLPNESMRVIAKPLVITQAVDLPGALVEKDIDHPSPSRAMEQVILQTPQVYDPNLVRSFLIAMGYYPLGSFVRLGSGEIARVVATNGEEVKKPVVKVILDANGRVPQKAVLVNLQKNPRLSVSHAVSGVPYEGLS